MRYIMLFVVAKQFDITFLVNAVVSNVLASNGVRRLTWTYRALPFCRVCNADLIWFRLQPAPTENSGVVKAPSRTDSSW